MAELTVKDFGFPESYQGRGVFGCPEHGPLGTYMAMAGAFARMVAWAITYEGWAFRGGTGLPGLAMRLSDNVVFTDVYPQCTACGRIVEIHFPPLPMEMLN